MKKMLRFAKINKRFVIKTIISNFFISFNQPLSVSDFNKPLLREDFFKRIKTWEEI